ncbi:hypothetical protein Tco_1161961, partial [Tanacetum coccineum]
FDSNPKRLEEDYHSIKDGVSLVIVYTTSNVVVRGMLISDDLLTHDIRTHRTPRATRTPNPEDVVQKKQKSKQVVREPSTPRKSLQVIFIQKKLVSTSPLPPSDDRERDDIAELTLLSLALHKTAKMAEEQENVAAVKEQLLKEDVEKIVEGEDEESYAIVDDDEVDKKKDDKKDDDDNDDDNADHDDHAFPPLYLKIEASQNLLPSKPRLFQEALLRVADELTVAKTNELIKVAVLRIVNEAAKKDGEILKTNVPNTLSIQHWKDSWHKRMYKINHRRVRDDLEEYFSNHRIVEVVRVTTKQQHRLDYMKQIIMMRVNDKPDSSSEADFKYLNKNDIEDIYYLFLNKKVKLRENKLLNSLMTFIRSRVIWERVHDFQLGIESYQITINLTAQTLIFHGIDALDPYFIVDKPTTGLIYLNSK